MSSVRHTLIATAAIALLAVIPLHAGPMCGPGNHWVDTCLGGVTTLTTHSVATLSLDLDRDGIVESFFAPAVTAGYTKVWLGPGQNAISPHSFATEVYDLLETMNTGLAIITLRGGDGIANGLNDGPLYSSGSVEEQGGNPALADHYVKVFFELEIPAGAFGAFPNPAMVLHNTVGLDATCLGLTQAPPSTCKYVTLQVLDLYDSSNVFRGTMGPYGSGDHHFVTPEPGSAVLLLTALGLPVLFRRIRPRP